MIEIMKKGKVNLIITYSLDQISKSQMQTLNFLQYIQKSQFNFYTIKEKLYSRDRKVFDLILTTLTDFARLD